MNLLMSFITNQLVKVLESEFIAHESELQEAFVNEVASALAIIIAWVNSKLSTNESMEIKNEERK